ncbi:MAG TPA: hypothetical protein VHI30_06640, partial [Gaiellales bacterium]|nr:hypothetical protein [Gaiellales bacterium]
MTRRVCAGAVAAAIGIVAVAGHAPAAAAHVAVLVQTTHVIADIDANADGLVWRSWTGLRRRPGCETVIRRRGWATGTTSTLVRCRRGADD